MEIRCKNCGSIIDVNNGVKTAVCDFCGMEQTAPKSYGEEQLRLFKEANSDRLASKFDIAKDKYERLIRLYPDDNEAYWCKILCEYGIEYVEDVKTEKKIPTCHRTVRESIFNNKDYRFIMQRASYEERKIYESEAFEIDRIQKGILAKAEKEQPYDIFICYKESDGDGKRTIDSQYASKIYTLLSDNGYKVFFSRVTLKEKLGSEYEPIIYSALGSSKLMLLVCSSPDHLNSAWVRNEWSRYLEFAEKDSSKTVLPCLVDMDAYDLPNTLSRFQVADMKELDFFERLLRQVNSKFNRTGQKEERTERQESKTFKDAAKELLVKAKDTIIDRATSFVNSKLTPQAEKVDKVINYNKAQPLLNSDLTVDSNYYSAVDYLTKAKGYKNADILLASLPSERAKQIEAKKQKERALNYRLALPLIKLDLTDDETYNTLTGYLNKARGYKDAEALLYEVAQKREKQLKAKRRKEERAKNRAKIRKITVISVTAAVVAVIVGVVIGLIVVNT